MTPDRLKEIEAWAKYARDSQTGFVISALKVGEWLEELVAAVRLAQGEKPAAKAGDTVHLVAATGLGYVGKLVDCAEARAAGSMPCPLCKEES